MLKWRSLLLGATTFLAAHTVIVAKWGVWFGGTHQPWFLNDGKGPLALMAACLCIAASIAAALSARNQYESVVHGVNVAVGATIAATAVLFFIGPGTIFPIVIAFCAMIALASAMVGATVVAAFQHR
jgi:hypothetical protein